MTSIIAVFRSRTQTLDFLNRLHIAGVAAQTVNTPKEANVGCGLSLTFAYPWLPKVRLLLSKTNYSTFVGFYTKNSLTARVVRLQ